MGKDLSETPFINTVPELDNNEVLLPYQHAFINKVLSYSFKYPNVVYNISNRLEDEAYLLANPGNSYGLYFVLTGSVYLDLTQEEGAFSLQWINVETEEMHGNEKRVKAVNGLK